MIKFCCTILVMLMAGISFAQHTSTIGMGWAGNTINTVVFRKNAVVSFRNFQYAAYYDSLSYMVLAKRNIGSDNWQVKRTAYKGNINDAHNSISIMVDGAGYLHVAWDHHGGKLRYCKSVQPGSLDAGPELPMLSSNETKVTYPEFYRLRNGDLLFLYRDGSSGNGNLVLNRYTTKTKQWKRIQHNLLDGENKRSAYWQAYVDDLGTFHISWVWRESGDVATNHDMCYARSFDGGLHWYNSDNALCALPIKAQHPVYVVRIPQKSELINSTSMAADAKGRPYIVTYWRDSGSAVPQYRLIYKTGKAWTVTQVSKRTIPFSLSGLGTKKIPVSRPQVCIADNKVYMLFRDAERGNKVSLTMTKNLKKNSWKTIDLHTADVGMWEPSFDTELWKQKKLLHIFVQKTAQGDGEKTEKIAATPVQIIEWKD